MSKKPLRVNQLRRLLGIRFDSLKEERYKYLFEQSFENEAIWTQVSHRFKAEIEGMTEEEKEAHYTYFLEKNYIGEIYYIFLSEDEEEGMQMQPVNRKSEIAVLIRKTIG